MNPTTDVRLVALDADGTLLGPDGLPRPRTLDVLRRLQQRGTTIVLATGRDWDTARHRLGDWGIADLIDHVVAFNGATLVNRRTGHIARRPGLPGATLRRLRDAMAHLPVSFAISHDGALCVPADDARTQWFAALEQATVRIVNFDELLTQPHTKLYVIADEADMPAVAAHAATLDEPDVVGLQTWPQLFEFMEAGVSKADGLAAVADELGFTLPQVVAFGDAGNDVEMLRECGLGVAMGNASPEAREAADMVIGPHHTDALASALEGILALPPAPDVITELETVARAVAVACADLVAPHAGAVGVAHTKQSATDVVTAMDQQSEELAAGMLATLRPDDAVVGEEGNSTDGTTGISWLVDPIDGTVNYLYGIPQYAVSVAAVVGDPHTPGCWWPVAAAVANPDTDELWTARRGGGARLIRHNTETPLQCRQPHSLAHTLVGTGFSYDAATRAEQGDVVARLLPQVRDIRRAGSAALDLCAVATGRLDAHYERCLQPWDIAGGWLIAEEAGARVTGLHQHRPSDMFTVAAHPGLHLSLIQALAAAGA